MTRQLTASIRHLSLTPTNRLAEDVYHQVKRGVIVLDPPYQRGSVWTTDQRLDLMYSFLSGYPIGTLILNDRMGATWPQDEHGRGLYAVVDGRQRLETAMAWFDGELAIPASWMPQEWMKSTLDTPDGPYATIAELTDAGSRWVESRMHLPVVTAQAASVRAEAEIYRLVNTGGTEHTPDDLARAKRVADQ